MLLVDQNSFPDQKGFPRQQKLAAASDGNHSG